MTKKGFLKDGHAANTMCRGTLSRYYLQQNIRSPKQPLYKSFQNYVERTMSFITVDTLPTLFNACLIPGRLL